MLDKRSFGHFQSKVYDWKVLEVACYSVMIIGPIGPIGMESPQHPAARNFHWRNWKTRCAIHTMTQLPGSQEKTPFIGFNGYLSVYQSM